MSILSKRLATVYIVLLGCSFIVLGFTLAMGNRSNVLASPYIRLFGIRDAFLGAYTLLLLIRNETRALFLFMAAATLLPILDTIALADSIGWARSAQSNLPFELPLILAVGLIARLNGAKAPWGTPETGHRWTPKTGQRDS